MEQSISQERHAIPQQSDDGQENLLTSPMATGGQATEVSHPISETEDIPEHLQPVFQQSGGGRGNDLNHSLLNGGEGVPRQESIFIQEPGQTCQLVNGQQQQPSYQQRAQVNGLSYPTQEIGLDTHQRRDRPELPYPIPETGPSAERTQDEQGDLPPNHPQLNGAYINGVSSTGEREHVVEHTCCRQELQLWRQESDRWADVTSHFVWKVKYIVVYVVPCMTGGNNLQLFNHIISNKPYS